jgi:hypothetical protein
MVRFKALLYLGIWDWLIGDWAVGLAKNALLPYAQSLTPKQLIPINNKEPAPCGDSCDGVVFM